MDSAEEPSPALAARVLSIPGLAPRSALPSPSRGGWAAIGAVAAAASVAALLVVTSVGDAPATFEPAGEPTALVATSGERTSITVQLGEAGDGNQQVRLVATGLSSDGRAYELWLEGPSGARKVGEFAPDKNGECSLLFPAPSDEWTAAIVTHADQSPGTGTIASATI
jgi:anti-sigma-K factor RskA